MATTRTSLFPAALLLTTVALLGSNAQAQVTWTFTPIADSSGELASFSVPSVNDSGQIAFVATFDDVAEGQAVYRKEASGVLTVVADTSGPIASVSGDPSMNAGGLVTFTATMDDGSVSVLRGDGGALATIANTIADKLSSIDSKPFISDTDGVVVLRAVRETDGARMLLTGTGGPPATLLTSKGPYDPQDVAGINADGVVAFLGLNGAGETGVYRTTDGVAVTTVAETSPGGLVDLKALDINNNDNGAGTVVYFRETAAGNGELVVATAGTSTPFADTADPSPFNSFGAASVAESGATAFRGFFDQGLDAIFAGGTGLYEKAIALHDPLLGSGVTALDTGPQAVTNAGQFVFRASRGNGTTGIYVGAPRSSGGGGGGGGGGAMDGASVALLLLAKGVWTRRRGGPATGERSGP